jgi:hypothetical protein
LWNILRGGLGRLRRFRYGGLRIGRTRVIDRCRRPDFLCLFRTSHDRGLHTARRKVRQAQGGKHEEHGDSRRHLRQETARALAAENRLGRAAKGRSQVSTLSPLEQYNHDQAYTGQYVQENDYDVHFFAFPVEKRI